MTNKPERGIEDAAYELLWSLTPMSNCGCGGYLDYDDALPKVIELLHQELQKAREEAYKQGDSDGYLRCLEYYELN
jgi:hypothetical protein